MAFQLKTILAAIFILTTSASALNNPIGRKSLLRHPFKPNHGSHSLKLAAKRKGCIAIKAATKNGIHPLLTEFAAGHSMFINQINNPKNDLAKQKDQKLKNCPAQDIERCEDHVEKSFGYAESLKRAYDHCGHLLGRKNMNQMVSNCKK